jgi:glycosyltransferase involved in cell wall biosynthesis
VRVTYLADAPYVHTRRWVRHFVDAGYDVDVVSFRPAEIEGARVHYVDGLERLGRLRYFAHAGRVRRLVESLQPDLLHAMHLTSYGFLAATGAARPLVTSVWGTDILEAPFWSPLHLALTRYALARADHLTATGLTLANATLRYAPPSKPVTVVPFGVDLERFQPDGKPRANEGTIAIGTVARLSLEKGHDVLLRAVARLVERGVDLRAVLAGDGPLRHRLERLAAKLRIAARVDFRGELPYDAVPSLLRELDIFVLPSTAEGFGVAALEAQAMQLPVIASNVHGIPDVVDDRHTGLLVPPRDDAALADAIALLAADPDRRASMGRAGRAFVEERYSWADNAAQMQRLYSHLRSTFTEDGSSARLRTSDEATVG